MENEVQQPNSCLLSLSSYNVKTECGIEMFNIGFFCFDPGNSEKKDLWKNEYRGFAIFWFEHETELMCIMGHS